MRRFFSQLERRNVEDVFKLDCENWPVFLRKGDKGPANKLYVDLYTEFPEFQHSLYEDERLIGVLNSAPLYWDGTYKGLPNGWNGALLMAFGKKTVRTPNTLCALAIGIGLEFRGRGLSKECILKMKKLAYQNAFSHLIAPVRPTKKVCL